MRASVNSRLDPAPTCWERKAPPGASTSHGAMTGCRLTTREKELSRNGSGPALLAATTIGSWLPAIARFGANDSVATSTLGSRGISANTSPPPV